MFENWKVGQTGWVRLRNGKVARAIQFGRDSRPVQIQFMKGDELSWFWINNAGLGFGSENSAIAHLPDCTGFDWEEPHKPHEWKVGDWFVVDKRHHDEPTLHWHSCRDKFVGLPMMLERLTPLGHLRSSGWSWHPSWCRPCAPPKVEPAPTRFKPFIEYVGIHDAI